MNECNVSYPSIYGIDAFLYGFTHMREDRIFPVLYVSLKAPKFPSMTAGLAKIGLSKEVGCDDHPPFFFCLAAGGRDSAQSIFNKA